MRKQESQGKSQPGRSTPEGRNAAIKSAAITLAVMALAEFAIMMVIGVFSHDPLLRGLLDSLVLLVIVCPVIYVLVYKPLLIKLAARQWAEEERDRFFELSSDLLCIVGLDGLIKRVNPAAENLLGLTADKILSKPYIEFVHPNDRTEVATVVEIAARDQVPVPGFECRIRDKNGSYRWIAWHGTLDIASGILYGIGRDVTEQRLVDQSLREQRDELEAMVAQRTAEVVKANEELGIEITNRRTAEERALAAWRRLSHLFAVSPAVIYALKIPDHDGIAHPLTSFVSQNVAAMFGYEVEECFAEHWWADHLHPDDRSRVVARRAAVLDDDWLEQEYRFQNKDGTYRWLHDASIVLRDDACEPLEIVGAWMDVTSAKCTLEDLKESEERYRKLVELAPDAIIVHSEGRIVIVNQAAVTLLGAEAAEQIVGKRILELVHPEYRETIFEQVRQAGDDGVSLRRIETKLLKLNGAPVDVEVVAAPITYRGNRAMHVVARDMTEHRRALAALRDSKRRYKELADALPQPVFETDENEIIVFGNRSVLNTFGYTREDLRAGLNLYQLVSPEQRPRATEDVRAMGMIGESCCSEEYEFIRHDGSIFPGIIYCKPKVTSDRTVGLRGVIVDISERKQKENELRRWRLEWERVFQSIGDTTVILDSQRRILAANRAAGVALRVSQEELIGKYCYKVFHDLNAPPNDCPLNRALASKTQETAEIELGALGTTCLVRCTPIFDDAGQIEKFIYIATDIGELKQSREGLRASLERLHLALEGTIKAISMIVETRDPYTAGHQRRVAALANSIAKEMGLSEEQTQAVRLAALIHDIGKIGVPAEILSKPGMLSETEFRMMKDHPEVGYKILSTIAFPWSIAEIVRQHHERLNGSGYPSGLSGNNILLEARVIGVADVVEALASHRPYRPAKGIDAAVAEISRNRGILYDPDVVDACGMVIRTGRIPFYNETANDGRAETNVLVRVPDFGA